MASTNGNTVSGGSTSAGTAYSWRCVVEIVVASESATQVKYTVRLKYYTRYSIDVYSNGKLSGGASGSWSGSMKSTSNSGKTTTVITKSVTVNKGSSSKSFSVSGQIRNTGGFGNGTSKATCKVTVPAIDYSAPNAPRNCAASRSSDSQAKVTWSNGSTSTTRPRSSTKVERQTDSGSWTQKVASVGASTANYTDNGISANHRYRYRVRAQGSGGYSGYATSGYVYTTPAAPTAVELVKTSDTQVQVSIQGAAQWADSYKLQRSVDSGAWADVASVASWPYVDTSGGGMVKYRVAAVKGSLQSAWTESAEIATITPPLAPSVTLSPSDAVLPVGTAVTVAWTPDHPDGSAQSSAQVEYAVAGSASTATVTGTATTYALPATALDAPATVSVRVRTKGLDQDWGAWSSPAQFTLAYPPSASITTPGIDGATVSELPLVARWTVDDSTGVAEQQLRLYEDGALVHTAQLSTDARSYEFGDSTYRLENKTDYSIELTVRGGSTLSVTEKRDFATDFAQPEAPEGLLSIDHGDLSVSIEVQAGPSQSDEGNPVEVVGREGVAMSGLTVYGNTRQNLWKNPSGTGNGVTLTSNDDGSMTVSGTAAAVSSFNVFVYTLKPSTSYYVAVDSSMTGARFRVGVNANNPSSGYVEVDAAVGGKLFKTPQTVVSTVLQLSVDIGSVLSGTYRVMLREATASEIAAAQQTASTLQEGGTADLTQEQLENTPMLLPELYADEPFDWCPPGIHGVEELTLKVGGEDGEGEVSTPIDLQGHALNSLPDGTRDELHVDSSGAVTMMQRVGYVASYTNQMIGDDWIASELDELGLPAQGATVIWLLDSAQTVELGSIEMPTYPYDTSYVSIASDMPTTLRVGYPVTSSLTVERQLPDGTRWTVGANLSDGEECIDPLPPLNLDYQYLVTASTDAGAAATTNVDARVDSTAAAFNFGPDASTCELLRLDPSWSRSPSITTELYDFADGGEAGGLPMAYTTDSLSVSGQESATTLDEEQYRRLLAIARRYAVGWVRDQLGGRQYCTIAWSFSGGVPRRLVECSVDMSEIRWREAW